MKINDVAMMASVLFMCLVLVACGGSDIPENTGSSLYGVIVLPSGHQDRELSDVVITLSKIGDPTPRMTMADEEGRYEFGNISPGTYLVRSRIDIENDDRLVGEALNINVNSGAGLRVNVDPMELEISLLIQELTIELSVVDAETGMPISDAPITMSKTGISGAMCLGCTTDRNGFFTTGAASYYDTDSSVTLKSETIVFQVSKEGYTTQIKETQTEGLKREVVLVVMELERSGPLFQVGVDNDWHAVENGENHSIALKNDGSLYEWGNYSSSLLKGDHIYPTHPARIGSDLDWIAITAGSSNNYAIKNNGSLWAWGRHIVSPMLFDGGSWDSVATAFERDLGIKSNGTLWSWGLEFNIYGGTGSNVPVQVGSNNHWQSAVVSISGYALALRDDNSLWAWGDNNCGQLGNGNTINVSSPMRVGSANDWSAIAVGGASSESVSFALKLDGTLWAWGCGEGSYKVTIPVQVGIDNDWQMLSGNTNVRMIKNDGTLWAWRGWVASPVQIENDSDWSIVSAGRHHSTAIKTDGTLWSWGNEWWDDL